MIKFKKCASTDELTNYTSVMVVIDNGEVKIGYIDYLYYGNGHGTSIVRFPDGSNIPIIGMRYCECELES